MTNLIFFESYIVDQFSVTPFDNDPSRLLEFPEFGCGVTQHRIAGSTITKLTRIGHSGRWPNIHAIFSEGSRRL